MNPAPLNIHNRNNKRCGVKQAVVLLSGGLDSATVLYYAKSRGYRCRCLSFDYGQRHNREIRSAAGIARSAGSRWQLLKIKLPWKGSSLLDKNMKICHSEGAKRPKNLKDRFFAPPSAGLRMTSREVPSTYVPGRNIIFLSFALSYAEASGAGAIFIGANAVDYSGYPDCRPEFISVFQEVINIGTKIGSGFRVPGSRLKVEAPLIDKSKKEIVKLAKRLKVPLELTWSCYKGGRRPCGACDSCILRAKGFREAGLEDPLYGSQDN